MTLSRDIRTQIICSLGKEMIIFKENPLFSYFCDDLRAEGIVVRDGKVIPIGNTEVDGNFQEDYNSKEACCLSPFYNFRKCDKCTSEIGDIFSFPTNEEIELIKEKKKGLEKIVLDEISGMSDTDTEVIVSNRLRDRLCSSGISLFYDPIVAFDRNIGNIWNRPSESTPGQAAYVEVSANAQGMSVIFSETILFTNRNEYVERYESLLNGIEKIKSLFIEGNETSILSNEMERFRRKNLYLTIPLFPFNHVPIPGENRRIRTRDTSVFDLWVMEGDVKIRKKVIAVAGYSSSMVF